LSAALDDDPLFELDELLSLLGGVDGLDGGVYEGLLAPLVLLGGVLPDELWAA
jgi:hypothetical protein